MKRHYFRGTPSTRLAAHTEVQSNGCWHWNGTTNNKGYGLITINGKRISTHRVAFESAIRPLKEGEQVLHRCDNPLCINPDHLFIGSPATNSLDKISKGRHAHGEKVGTSKLTVQQVRDIRNSSKLQSELAKTYGVTQPTISKIKSRARWSVEEAVAA